MEIVFANTFDDFLSRLVKSDYQAGGQNVSGLILQASGDRLELTIVQLL